MGFAVIADHIRSLAFAIGDGAFQVMKVVVMSRRLLRRATHGRRLRHFWRFLCTNLFQYNKLWLLPSSWEERLYREDC